VLTAREQEVLRLIARGLSNTEISQALVISEQTTKTHVGHILANSTCATARRPSSSPTKPAWSPRGPRITTVRGAAVISTIGDPAQCQGLDDRVL
jgi:hypothetical protein